MYALNAKDGTVRWRQPIVTPLHPLVINDVIYVTSTSGAVYALNASDGTVRWRSPLNARRASASTVLLIARGELYVGTIDLGGSSSRTMIHALNASNGVEDWHASVSWNVDTVGVAA